MKTKVNKIILKKLLEKKDFKKRVLLRNLFALFLKYFM